MTQPQTSTATVRITVTESITQTYEVTAAQLAALQLPVDTDSLEELNTDDLAVTLLDEGPEPTDYSVTDREIDIEAVSPTAAPTA